MAQGNTPSLASKPTRRQWVALLGAAPLVAQAPAPAPSTAAEELAKAVADMREESDAMRRFELADAVEPAFRFVA